MGKGGGYMAEAAVVLPLVILAIVTIVLILMFFYEESVEQSRLHMELRHEAAVVTGHVPEEATESGESSAVLEVSRDGLFKNISGYTRVRMISRGLLSSLAETEIEDSWHGADGVLFKRLFD